MTIENTNVSRRTLVKGAAWSLPVVAVAAATPLAAASTAGTDLVPALSGPINLNLTALGLTVATVNVVNTLTITNVGTVATPATGTTASLVYNPSLLTLNIAGAGVTVLGSDGNYTLNLPSIAPGGTLVINLGTTLDTLLDLSLLTSILGGPTPTMAATVSGDGVTGNNSTSTNIGITLL
ncbi:hypothetical protein ACUOFU_04230 [Microbacterium arabinogalactanolyticum]|uniref:hypothetical protein n=1 Tax=Microbacterium arabinogalactanolyticum TaxID=69365 RepID=UPI004043AE64